MSAAPLADAEFPSDLISLAAAARLLRRPSPQLLEQSRRGEFLSVYAPEPGVHRVALFEVLDYVKRRQLASDRIVGQLQLVIRRSRRAKPRRHLRISRSNANARRSER